MSGKDENPVLRRHRENARTGAAGLVTRITQFDHDARDLLTNAERAKLSAAVSTLRAFMRRMG